MRIFKSKRILVIGSCGAGKSTLSKKLNSILSLPVIHLDAHYHKPNWQEPIKEDWERILQKLVRKPKWIMDGNYSDSFAIRIPRADTIIYLDYGSISCLYRVIKRNIKYYGTNRSDMAKGCKESFDFSFLKFVLLFNHNNKKEIYKRLKGLKRFKQVIILKSDSEVKTFLTQLRQYRVPESFSSN